MSLAEDLPRSYSGSLSRPTAHKLSRVSLADLASRTVSADSKFAARRLSPATADDGTDGEDAAVVALPRKADRAEATDPSLDLLDRASKGMSFMLNRYKQLEDHVKQVDAWSNAQIQAAEVEAARWRDEAATAEKRAEESQRTLEIMVRRLEAAEQTMQRDREALSTLQERIIQAFGFGSEAHEAIAAGLELG